MDIEAILTDWKQGQLTHGEIIEKYSVSYEVEFAITECSGGLDVEQIKTRLNSIKPGMSGEQIREMMQ